MGGLFGGGQTISTSEPRLGALNIQTSAYGMVVPLVYGTNRIPANLVDYTDFNAIANTTTQSAGGKGGDVTTSNTTYTYTCAVALGLCQGQISGIGKIWAGKDLLSEESGAYPVVTVTDEVATIPANGKVLVANALAFKADIGVNKHTVIQFGGGVPVSTPLNAGTDYTVSGGMYTFAPALSGTQVYISYTYQQPGNSSALAQLNLTLFDGGASQNAWGFMATNHPGHDLGYRGFAYVASPAYALGGSASLPTHSFEVFGKLSYGTGLDANPKEIIIDFLTAPGYGAGFPASKIGDLGQYSNYCLASKLLISPALNEQSAAQQTITDLTQATNSALVWSEGKLKIIPYGDTALVSEFGAFEPNVTPIYDLTDDDFLGDSGSDPVIVTRKSQADAYNQVQVEFLNRANQYNVEIATAQDQANIDLYGLRPLQPVKMHFVCQASIAQTIAQLLLQRNLYIRNVYEFKLGWKYALLEPMDLVTLTDAALGLNLTAVRITAIEENEDGELSITAEEFPAGIAHATIYKNQEAVGYSSAYNQRAPDVAPPAFFEAATQNTTTGLAIGVAVTGQSDGWGGCEVWLSYDNASYKRMGTIHGGARYGTLTANLAAAANAVASVQLAGNGGKMLGGSATEAVRLATLCLVENEFCAHTGAALTGANKYDLTMSVRGAYSTPISQHATGAKFIRVDSAVLFSDSLDLSLVGKTLYFKFVSFNQYLGGAQSLAEVQPYTYTVTGVMASLPPSDVTGLTAITDGDAVRLGWDVGNGLDFSNYEIREGDDWETGSFVQATKDAFYTIPHVSTGSHTYRVREVDTRQNYSVNDAVTSITMGGAAGGTSSTPGATIKAASVKVDALGNAIISFTAIQEPQISGYELRSGTTFESGAILGTTTGGSFSVPVLSVTGQTLWIKGVYAAGGYTAASFRIAFGSASLGQVQGLSWRISEPDLVFTWSAVAGAAQYVAVFEDGGVSRVKVVATPEVSFAIPKWGNSQFRVFGISSTGALTPYNDINISLAGVYNYNEVVNINLPITTGNYINLAFTSANQIKRVSLLGSDPVAPYALNINDADLYSFGYNLQNLAASNIQNVQAAWFRDGFWREKNGFFESGVLDLGSILSGKLLLNLSKTVTYSGAGAVNGYANVNAEYMADALPQELTDTKAFLSARLLVASDSANSGNWTEVQNGDWVTGVRYVKLVVEVAMAGALTDITVTAGYITLDVPDISEQGTLAGVTTAGATLTFTKSYHHISAVLLTAQGAAKAYSNVPTLTGCTVYVDAGTQNVGYFIKGY